MIYPMDPDGPFGQEYPKGFLKWYMAVIVLVVVAGFFLLGCTPKEDHANAIMSHCAETAFTKENAFHRRGEAIYRKCVDDSLWAIEEMTK